MQTGIRLPPVALILHATWSMYFSWPVLQERKLSAELFDSIREYAKESHKGLAAHVFGPRRVDGHGV